MTIQFLLPLRTQIAAGSTSTEFMCILHTTIGDSCEAPGTRLGTGDPYDYCQNFGNRMKKTTVFWRVTQMIIIKFQGCDEE